MPPALLFQQSSHAETGTVTDSSHLSENVNSPSTFKTEYFHQLLNLIGFFMHQVSSRNRQTDRGQGRVKGKKQGTQKNCESM